MSESLEHDSNEDAERTEGKPLPLSPEPHPQTLAREDIKAARGMEERPWNAPDNPAVWNMLVGDAFDDDDDEIQERKPRYRNLET